MYYKESCGSFTSAAFKVVMTLSIPLRKVGWPSESLPTPFRTPN